jgi:hypothetical protein
MKTIKTRDINKNGVKEGWEKARAEGMAKGMGARLEAKKGGKATHKTKDGRTAKKGLWYNIHQKRKRGGTPRKPGSKGAPTAAAFKRSQKTSKK